MEVVVAAATAFILGTKSMVEVFSSERSIAREIMMKSLSSCGEVRYEAK